MELFPTAGPYGVWALVFMAIGALIKGWPALRKIGLDADSSFRADLMKRVACLERDQAEMHRQMLVLYGALTDTLGHLPVGSPVAARTEAALRSAFPTISRQEVRT